IQPCDLLMLQGTTPAHKGLSPSGTFVLTSLTHARAGHTQTMMAHGLTEPSAKSLQNIPLICRQVTDVLSTFFSSWEILIFMAQY
ncbi:MAG: hypothetical protein RIC80_12735, partial [Cyclobacteriaceae bacterium]